MAEHRPYPRAKRDGAGMRHWCTVYYLLVCVVGLSHYVIVLRCRRRTRATQMQEGGGQYLGLQQFDTSGGCVSHISY